MAKQVTLLLCITLILFINTYSSVKIDDDDFDEEGILIDTEEYDEDVEEDEEEEDHSMPDLSEFWSKDDKYPGPPEFP